MSKPRGRSRASNETASASTPAGELQRHLKALDLESADDYRAWCRRHGFTATLDKSWQERRTERLHAERLRAKRAALEGMADHFQALGVSDEADYLAWCRARGFAETLDKRARQKADEVLAASRERSAQALAASRRFDRRPEETLRAIADGAVAPEALGPPHLRAIHALFVVTGSDSAQRAALLRLLLHCQRTSRLLTADPAIAHFGPSPANTYPAGLLALARRHREWLSPPESWKPDSHSARRQFGTLARCLLARYDVPAFMDAAWFTGDRERARQHQEWFIHIGAGRNIRTASVPLHLTKRAAHLFL